MVGESNESRMSQTKTRGFSFSEASMLLLEPVITKPAKYSRLLKAQGRNAVGALLVMST